MNNTHPNQMRQRWMLFLLVGACLICAAFVAFIIGRVTSIPRKAAATTAPVSAGKTNDEVVERLVRRVRARGDNTLDILILSGGGQMGAYGTGFLRGWKARGAEAMPRFDVATGISTGSLIAPFALLGTDDALRDVNDLYRNAVEEIGPTFDPLIFIRRTGGVLNRKKLERTIERVVDERFAGQLRQAFREDRQLFIGTTDLNRGIGRIWSIGDELNPNAAGLSRARAILLASTAIPGAFAPVYLDGQPHVDGGVATNLLLGATLDDFRQLADRLRASGIKQTVRVRLWVLVNFWLYPPVQTVNAKSVNAIRERSNAIMFSLKQQLSLTRFWELAQAVSSGVPGLTMEMRYTSVPQPFANDPAAAKLFNQPFMDRLEQAGYQAAQSRTPWQSEPLNMFARPAQ